MPSNTERFALIFRGLEKAYGAIDLTQASTSESGKRTGKYQFVQQPRTTKTFEAHLNGKSSIGIVPINEENECVWGAIDVDTYPLDHGEIVKKIKKLSLPLVVCRSKSGGGHLFLFLKKPVAAKKLQLKLKVLTSELGYAANTEVFPKQIELLLDRGDNGNFLNLPYFDLENGLRYAVKEDGTAATLEQFLDMAETSAISEETLDSLLSEPTAQVKEMLPDGPPCLEVIMRNGAPEGTRNNALFSFGVYLRKKYPDTDEWDKKFLHYNTRFIKPPLGIQEVHQLSEQLRKKEYQYKCTDMPLRDVCNKPVCLTRKYGVGGGENTPTLANLRKLETEPPLWFVDVNGKPVELDTDGLQRQSKFQQMCMEQINYFPKTLKNPVWETQMFGLMDKMLATEGAIIESPEDTGLRGKFYDLLKEFCTMYAVAEEKEEIVLRRPWPDEKTGRTHFRLRDLEAFLKRNNFTEYKSNKITQRIKDIGGKSKQLRIGGNTTRLWHILSYGQDLDEVEEEEEATQEDTDEVSEDGIRSRIKDEEVPF